MKRTAELLVIIPAAGFGRRVGSPESKEMMPRNGVGHLIDWPLKLASSMNWPVHVITRREKPSLIEHLRKQNLHQSVATQIVAETRDWPETVLKSKPYWKEWNLVFLPDMEFSPEKVLIEIQEAATSGLYDLVVAVHQVEKINAWGFIVPTSENETVVAEKPALEGSSLIGNRAWGLYAFRKDVGEQVLIEQLRSTSTQQLVKLKMRTKCIELDRFKDLTR